MYGVFRHRPRDHRTSAIPVVFTKDLHITAGWDTTNDTNLMGYKSGLRLRKEDIPNDFSLEAPLYEQPNVTDADTTWNKITGLTVEDVPSGQEFKYSRKNVRTAPSTSELTSFNVYTPGHIYRANVAQCKPTAINFWYKTPYHNASVNSGQYVIQWGMGQMLQGRETQASGDLAAILMMGAEDVHSPYAPGESFFSYGNTTVGYDHVFGKSSGQSWVNNTWHKYTITLDWTNQEYDVAIDGITYLSDLHFTNDGFWTEKNWDIYEGSRDHISWYFERADGSITTDDETFTDLPFTYWAITDFCRLFLHTGTAIQTHTFETASENIQRVALSWTESVYEDTTITMEYGRSLPHDDPSLATALTEATGHPASACFDGNDSTYCESTGNTQDIIYHFSTARTIAKVGIYLISTESTTYAFYGSADGETWSASLASGTYTPACTGSGQDIVIGSPASYEYFKVSCATASTVIKIGNIQLREAVASHNTSAAASIVVQTRVSTDSGVNWSAWTAHTSGNNIADITNPSVYTTLQVQTKMIFNTENPRYQPVMSQMLLDVYGVSDNVTADIQLKIQGEGRDALTTIAGCLVGGSSLVSEQQSSLVN
jgi:hypothetical protein